LTAVCAAFWLGAFAATHVRLRLPPTGQIPSSDKTLHFVGYLGLGLIVLLTLHARSVRGRRRNRWMVGWLLTYAVLDEMTQPWFGRHAAFADWVADLLGVLTACALGQRMLIALYRYRRSALRPVG
jgi:VanZ family protein